MAAPAYTYSLTNGTTADASQVMQDFNDILNGVSDGTKDLTMSALTANGAANLKAAVTLGASSSNDLTINGALASTIAIKTTNSFDIGSSTKGLRAVYFGANSQTAKIQGSASMSATWTLTLPVTAGSNKQVFQTDGSGNASWGAVDYTMLPIVVPGTSAGAVSSSGLTGYTGGSAIAAGYVGQVTTSTVTAQTFNAAVTGVTSLGIPAGVWLVSAVVSISGNQANNYLEIGISTTTGSFSGLTESLNLARGAIGATNNTGGAVVPAYVISISGTTTYYLNVSLSNNSVTGCNATLQAVRIA